ncbi:MAG: transaldolase [Phycisphaerales bacterium]|nr:MAG: transaldolase [Phycisphaerales bacterium]
MKTNFRKLTELGQSIWCDNIRRGMIASGELQALIDEGVLGVTSNPTILQKAIGQSSDYDAVIRDLVTAGTRAASDIYESLAFDDIGQAADLFRPVYDGTERRDGFVSIEVEPALADDTEGTVARARQIFSTLGRPNVMIKVPATDAGLPAVARLIGEGINVNVTLIFSVDVYQHVIDAYITGLGAYLDGGGDPAGVASVASFFVSRVDTVVDQRLQERIAAGQTHLSALLGKAAVANAKVAYDKYMDQFHGPTFAALAKRGARVQRPLWASTSTKNPAYRDTIYVDTLIGPNTVNTAPPVTLDAIRRFDGFRVTLRDDVELARATLADIEQAGIPMAEVTEELRQAGVRAFADSFDRLLADIQAKGADLASR